MRARLNFRSALALAALLNICVPLCGVTGAAEAQQAPAQQRPAKQAPAAQQSAAEPSASHLAAARELVVVSGMSRSFAGVLPTTMQRLTNTFTQTRPELAPDLAAVLVEIKPEFDKRTDQMIDTAAHIFVRLMTEQEVTTAVAFFKSDVGKKYVQVQPIFFNEVINAMQDWQQQMSQDMVARVREEMKKKGHDL